MEKKIKIGRIKTIDLHELNWFDKSAGNTYFSAQVVINFGMKDQKTVNIPYQYGYGSHCEDVASKLFDWPENRYRAISSNCRENGIIFRNNKRDAKKRELMEFCA